MSTTKPVKLPAALLRQLGKKPDSELAREFQIPAHQIRTERRRRHIRTASQNFWTKEKLKLLGTMPDADVAKKLGIWTNTVFNKRVTLSIPPFNPSMLQTKFQWKAAHLKRLGKESDARIAKELGISESVVTAKRHSLAIPPSGGASVSKHPWTKQELAMLGKKPDTIVAAETGRGRRHVRAKRESLGIPAFQMQRSIPWTKSVIRQMGKVSDEELAASLGVSRGTVALYRRQIRNKSSEEPGGNTEHH